MKKIISVLFFFFSILLVQNTFSETLRISPEQLKKLITEGQSTKEKSLIILDARNTKDYQSGHIKGALNFPIVLTYKNQSLNGKISSPAATQKNFRSRGISMDSSIIVYDNGDLVDAARLFWILEVYGIKNVKVLDHGFDDWLNKKYPVSFEKQAAVASQYIARLNHRRLASQFTTQLATKNINQIIIDARSISDYMGKTSSAKRFGHIPTALSIPSSHNISLDEAYASLKPLNKLLDVYSDIPKEKKIIIYCAIGRVSSANYLALRELGYDVSNYDASWNEWGNDDKLPIEK
ncbi:MAG: sulfurtransferase [Gammaproteobacteria bacterium]|nr:sulfurtransferase [Gammaproteobacteria bacterium]